MHPLASVEQAIEILKALGMPSAQQNRMAGLTLIALCGLTPNTKWSRAQKIDLTVSKGIMNHVEIHYRKGKGYASNTRESFRRQVLHQFIQGHIADLNPSEPNLPTNSSRTHYAMTEAALKVVRLFGTKKWASVVEEFHQNQDTLIEKTTARRSLYMVPVRLPNGKNLQLSPGMHNKVQKAVVEEFAPRFAPGAYVLYMGDTAKKDLLVAKEKLEQLNIDITDHGKLPDIVLHDETRNWLFLIEAVTSHGPMSSTRVSQLKEMTQECRAKPVYVSAFSNFTEFRKYIQNIAWDTEIWLCDKPDHMIHYNGDRFLGPRR